jgi:hypothetical protein
LLPHSRFFTLALLPPSVAGSKKAEAWRDAVMPLPPPGRGVTMSAAIGPDGARHAGVVTRLAARARRRHADAVVVRAHRSLPLAAARLAAGARVPGSTWNRVSSRS